MDLNVEFADSTIKKIAVSRDCMLKDAVKVIANKAGLSSVADKLGEFSLAWKDENSDDWIDVSWLLPDIPLRDQGVGGSNLVLFRKKYFVSNEDMDTIDKNPVLLTNIYHQLHHTFVAGLYKCTAFQAVTISAVAACAEFPGLEMRSGSLVKTGRLKQILPEEFRETTGIEQNILKAMQNLNKLSEDEAQKSFIQRIRKLETFGQSFFSVTFPDEEDMGCDVSLLGIGAEFIHWIDGTNMESFTQWDIEQVTAYGDHGNIFSLQFADSTGISVVSDYTRQITQFLQGIKKYAGPTPQQYASPLTYRRSLIEVEALELKRSDDEESIGEKLIRIESPELFKVEDCHTSSEPKYMRSSPQPEETTLQQPSSSDNVKPQKPAVTAKKPVLSNRKSPLLTNKLSASDNRSISPSNRSPSPSKMSPSSSNKSPSPSNKSPSPSKEEEGDDVYAMADTAPLVVRRVPLKDSDDDTPSSNSPVMRRHKQEQGKNGSVFDRSGIRRQGGKRRPESILREMEENSQKARLASRRKPILKPGGKEAHSEDELLAPTLLGRKSKLASRKLRAMSMRVDPTYQRLEDLEGILHDNLRASSWADETNPIYDKVAASEVQNFIEDSEVTYESLSTDESEAKTEAAPTADSNTKRSYVNFTIYSDMDEDVFKKGNQTPKTKNRSSKTVGFGETTVYQDPVSQFEGPKDDMGDDIYQDPSESMLETKKASGPSSNNAKMDDMGDDVYQDPATAMVTTKPDDQFGDDVYQDPATAMVTTKPDDQFGDDVYQDPTTAIATVKPDDPFGEDVYQDPATVESTKKPDDGFGEDSIYKDPSLTEKTDISEEDPYEDLSSVQTAVAENKIKRTESKETCHSDTTLLRTSSSISSVVSKQGTLTRQFSPSMGKRPYKPGHSRVRAQGSTSEEILSSSDTLSRRQAPRLHNTMKDYSTLLRDYRVFYVKLPMFEMHSELVNINQDVSKLIQRLCVIIGAKDIEHYNLFVEGACLSGVKETTQDVVRSADGSTVVTCTSSGFVGLTSKSGTKTSGTLNYFDTFLLRTFAMLPDQGSEPILLDPRKSLKEQNISTSRILALRMKLAYDDTLPDKPLRVPPHIQFHQCWISIVQGNQPVAMDDAIRLAALQYQAYFLDRTEANSVVGFCKPTEFLPVEYSTVRNISEKVYKEQQTLTGYTRQLSQEVYIHTCSTLPTSSTIFFPVKEPSKKRKKLLPMYLGVNKEGVMRIDIKTKEVLDMWEYRVLKNWAFTTNTFMLAFEKKTYPVQTNQGKWIKEVIDFHVKGILKSREAITKPSQPQGMVRTKPQPQVSKTSKASDNIKFTTPTPQNGDYNENIYDVAEDDIYDIPDDLQNLIPK